MRKFVLLVALAFISACAETPTPSNPVDLDLPMSFGTVDGNSTTHILLLEDDVLESDLRASVESAGGVLESFFPFGVAVVSTSGDELPGTIDGVESSVVDVGFDIPTEAFAGEAITPEDFGYPPNSGDDDIFFDLQWGHNYVGAQEAWAAGYRGQGVRVAVLDGGFDIDHPDIAPNLNLALSMDFTGEGLEYNLPSFASHGTHVAGTIAAADNGIGTIGVAPEAELVGVKVLSDFGSGSFYNVIQGIYWAAYVGSDVMNMSLGAAIPRTIDAQAVSALAVAVSHAILWAKQQGTLVIVSGGNAASDLDGDGDIVRFQTGLAGTTGISALTPLDWASEPNQQLVPASYTNYGTSMIDFSAPGGSRDFANLDLLKLCTIVAGGVLPITRRCWIFDYVLSTGNGTWYWSFGTSMAAPHAAGVAALIISENGGKMKPAAVERELRARAIQMARGRDDYFGHGLANSGH
jgi:subtilisin family serine protease